MKKTKRQLLTLLAVILIAALCFNTGALAANDSEWSSFRGNGDHNGVINAKTPQNESDSDLNFALSLKDPFDWSTNISDPIMVNGNIFIAVGNELLCVNNSGSIIAKGALQAPIDYTCRPLY